MGRVKEVKIEARNNSLCKISKAKVNLNLSSPLKIGTIVDLGSKKW